MPSSASLHSDDKMKATEELQLESLPAATSPDCFEDMTAEETSAACKKLVRQL